MSPRLLVNLMLCLTEKSEHKIVYSGTLVASGLAVYRVTAIGSKTKNSQLGQSLLDIKMSLHLYKFK
jgi:magnesium-transporting ATPase (P-type)